MPDKREDEAVLPWFDIADLRHVGLVYVGRRLDHQGWPCPRAEGAHLKLPDGRKYFVRYELRAIHHFLKELYGDFYSLQVEAGVLTLRVPRPHFGWWCQGRVLGKLKLFPGAENVRVEIFPIEIFDQEN